MKRLGRIVGLATELGMTMGLTAAGLVVLGLVAGRWIDARLGTSPFGTILLVIAGAVAGQIAVYRLVTRTTRRRSEDSRSVLHAQDILAALGLALRALAMIASPSLIGAIVGLWIDRRLGTGITATLILVLGGLVAGFVGAIRLTQARRMTSDEKGDRACSLTED